MAASMRTPRPQGFTLIELMVAVAVMALVAILSWRGLDGMVRAQATTQQRADESLALQTALAQWAADLDAIVQLPQTAAIEWDGRALRMTRRGQLGGIDAVYVVAWASRGIEGSGTWLRWQSPPVTTREQHQQVWQQAAQWAQNPGVEERRREVTLMPLTQ